MGVGLSSLDLRFIELTCHLGILYVGMYCNKLFERVIIKIKTVYVRGVKGRGKYQKQIDIPSHFQSQIYLTLQHVM